MVGIWEVCLCLNPEEQPQILRSTQDDNKLGDTNRGEGDTKVVSLRLPAYRWLFVSCVPVNIPQHSRLDSSGYGKESLLYQAQVWLERLTFRASDVVTANHCNRRPRED